MSPPEVGDVVMDVLRLPHLLPVLRLWGFDARESGTLGLLGVVPFYMWQGAWYYQAQCHVEACAECRGRVTRATRKVWRSAAIVSKDCPPDAWLPEEVLLRTLCETPQLDDAVIRLLGHTFRLRKAQGLPSLRACGAAALLLALDAGALG